MYDFKCIEYPNLIGTTVLVKCTGPNGAGPEWLPIKQDWSERWCTLSGPYTEDFAKRIDAFATRETDVFLVSVMKSGSTWMQELAWLLLNKLDYEGALSEYGNVRNPYLEHSGIDEAFPGNSLETCDKIQTNPRLIKSHLPAQFLPRQVWTQGRKIIYVARNAKDVVVSTYHYLYGIGVWEGSLDQFVDSFIDDKITFNPHWAHVIDFYRMRSEENIFFVTYEEMIRNLEDVIRRLSRFVGCQDLSDCEMEKLLNHLKFKNMKESKFGNHTNFFKTFHETKDDFDFMRRGIIGSYKDELSSEQVDKIDKWTQRCLQEYGISESDIFGEI
ncbi:sulfotransferase 1B1-like [Drosophila kikkawai]|uniref:Sulfotransferase 1B1-like n=1 Tax=Drosophila kikkawai TaxID=30033 RepID=A0A6P4J937_DROKI|nr:sulfotransferase family cytosolic 1B member 1-like [Drosophila kikkawai]